MKPTVSFDVDDVVADFHGKYRALAHEMFPHYGELPVADAWDQPGWPLTPVERTILHMTWKTQPNFYVDLQLVRGVDVRFMRMLAERTHLIFTTARVATPQHLVAGSAHAQTVLWLREKFDIEPNVVVAEDKGPVLVAARALFHVDDSVKGIADITKHYLQRGLRPLPLFMYPHCQNAGHPLRYPDWNSLTVEIEKLLERYESRSVFAR